MNVASFIKSSEYQEFKAFIFREIKDRAIEVKTDGKTADVIALECKSSELAAKKINKAIKSFERSVGSTKKIIQPFR